MRRWTLPGVAIVVVLAWVVWSRFGLVAPEEAAGAETGAIAQGELPIPAPVAALDVRLAGRAAIAGTVYDPGGAPLAGATVCAHPGTMQLRGEDALRRHCTTSERDGHYRLENLFAVPQLVNAAAPGFAPVMFFSKQDSGAPRHLLRLRPGAELRGIDLKFTGIGVEIVGIVEDLSGGPVEGAEVTYGGLRAGTGMAFASSDAEGGFSLWVRPGQVSVRAEAEGYAAGGDAGPAPGHRFEVLLTPEAVLIGKVVRALGGAPVAGAEIHATANSSLVPVLTDAGGNFRIAGLHPGAYKPRALADDLFGVAAELVLLSLGETSAPIVIEAHPAFAVTGKVVISDGRSCEDGSVTLTDPRREGSHVGSVEADGIVVVRGVLPGVYAVSVRCTGFLAAETYPQVEVAYGSVSELRWEVAPGRAIRGVIVDARGEPVMGVKISARPQVDPAHARGRTSTGRSEASDERGRFEVLGLLPGAYALSVFTSSGSQTRLDPPPVVTVADDRDLEEVRVAMPAVGMLRGTVRDTQGRGIARAVIGVVGAQSRQGRTADDGAFQIEDLAAGSYMVAVQRGSALLRPPGQSDDDQAGQAVEIEAEAVATIELVVADPSGTIVGVVRDEHGVPMQDAYVEASRESDSAAAAGGALQNNRIVVSSRPVVTDGDGRFRLEGLSPGKYTLQAQRPRAGDAVVEHVALGEDVVLTLAAPSRLAGTVSLPGGGAPDEFSVTVDNRRGGFTRTDRFFRTGGRWGFDAVPPGALEVQVSAPAGAKKLEVTLGVGEQRSDVRVELAAKVTVRGTVVDLSGEPVVGVEVKISASKSFTFALDEADRRHVSDDAGRFEVAHAPTGPVTVLIGAADRASAPVLMELQIASGSPVVELPPLRISRPRTQPGEAAGALGYVLQQASPGTPMDQVHHVVALVDAAGPAAAAGLQVGDEIVSVDGHDVTGARAYLYRALTAAPAGTTLQIGLARGATLAVTAGERP